MRFILAGLAGVAGWYLYQRLTAGNSYAAQSFALIEPAQAQEMDYLGGVMSTNNNLQPLRYFTAAEFGQWWPDMSTDLLQKLDEFRNRLGVPVIISPANGSLGRHLGAGDLSQHNVDMWGEVRAADVMFSDEISLETAYQVAKSVGFTGIGAYPDWQPMHGLHLDVRQAPLALWSGIKEQGAQIYKSITEAFG